MELAARKEEIVRKNITKSDALKMFGDRGEEYKVELISELEDGTISTYTQGAFTDLCRGPHLPNTAPIKAVKILSIAGAYWRGDEKRHQLTRLYGITFPKKKMLDEYLTMLEEAKKRDHRKIGKEMELFMFSDTVGKGLPMWLPRRNRYCVYVCNHSSVAYRPAMIIKRSSLLLSETSSSILPRDTTPSTVKTLSNPYIHPKREKNTSSNR